jgi:predicted transcriptional regulator
MFCTFVSNLFDMNYLELKNTLHEMIDQVEDPEVLYALQELLKNQSQTDFWDELPEEVKESIEIGLKQAENGEVIPHEEMVQRIEEKLAAWQLKRIDESHQQITEGKYFTNEQADLLFEKWLRE